MARVNIVKRIKVSGRWIMRSIPRKRSGGWDWNALPNGRYYVEWYEQGARKREPAGTTVAQALEVRRRRHHQVEGQALGLLARAPAAVVASDRPLRALIDRHLEQTQTLKKPNTYRKYEAVLGRFCEFFPDRTFESLSFEELNDFVVHLKKRGMEANTVLHNVVIIAQFFKCNGRSGIMRELQLPERSIPLPREYSDTDLQKFFAACDKRERALFSTFLMTGFRQQEVMYLVSGLLISRISI